jgi:hypothetical protein
MSENKTSPDVSPEVRARFVSPATTSSGLMLGLLALIVLATPLIAGATSIYAYISGVIGSAFILWIFLSHASAIEAWPDALVAIYPFGFTRRIPFEKVTKLRIVAERTGPALAVYTRISWLPDILIWLGSGYSLQAPSSLDSMLDAIRESANLTRFRTAFFGMPIYEREH